MSYYMVSYNSFSYNGAQSYSRCLHDARGNTEILTLFRREPLGVLSEPFAAPGPLKDVRSPARAAVLGMVTIGNRVTSAYFSVN